MSEAFDLRRMLEEIVEDEKISTSKRKKISQADIRRMLKERNRASAMKQPAESAAQEHAPARRLAAEALPAAVGSPEIPPRSQRSPIASPGVTEPEYASAPDRAGYPHSLVAATVFGIQESRGADSLLPPRIVRQYRVIPVRAHGRVLHLEMENPADFKAIQDLELLTGMRVEAVGIPSSRMEEALAALGTNGGCAFALSEALGSTAESTRIREILAVLSASGGFDLLVTAGSSPALKTHSGLEATGLPPFTPDQCVQCAKGLMTESQWETLLQRHSIDVAVELPELGRFRVSAYRQRGSVSLAIRKVPKVLPPLWELQVPPSLDAVAQKPHGLAIFASPTAQGRTTTMNAVLHSINTTMERNIITLEDPVETLHAPIRCTISQREIGRDAASVSEGLSSICRQAPDVIAIGDVCDSRTFRLALEAACSGHLVLCTMRAFNATSALDSMIHQFPFHLQAHIRQQLTESLLLVFCQRLVPTVDRQSLIVLHETLFNSPRVRELLREGQLSLLRTQLHQGEEDFVPMDLCLKNLLHEGRIAVQDGALLAENPAFVLGADIHSPY